MLQPDYIEHFTDDAQGAVMSCADEVLQLYASYLSPSAMRDATAASVAELSGAIARQAVLVMAKHSHMIASIAAKVAENALRTGTSTDVADIGRTIGMLPASVQHNLKATTAASVASIRKQLQRDNLAMLESARESYLSAAMQAVSDVNGRSVPFEDACRSAVVRLSDAGISIVDYRSGARAQADVAVRRHIRTQVVQAGAENTLSLLDGTGHDLVQTSSHGGSRKEHARWQGRIFSLSGGSGKYPNFYKETGYGDVGGLCGANCKHSFGIYLEGQPKRYPHDPDAEEGLDREEVYQATQTQRYHERSIRKYKRESANLQAAGLDDTVERLKVGNHQKALRELTEEHGFLSREYRREQVYEHKGKRVYPLSAKPAP
jgi:hypothetical protein